MTTKYRIAEQILLELNKRSYDSAITMQQVMLKVNQSLAYLVRMRYFASKQSDTEELDGSLIFTFKDVSVTKDADRDEYYTELPATTMSLPNGIGIRSVIPKGSKREYRPVTNGFSGLYEGMISSKLEGSVGYYQENEKLFFVNMDSTNNPEYVLMKIVLPLDGIDEDASLNIPMDMQEEVISYVVQKYMATPIKDTTADNVDQV